MGYKMLRVIAGEARSVPLKSLPGEATRPTTDRIKETLFNILQDDLYGCRFLDLYAGTGQMGIEALSRGAREAVFVENNKKAYELIISNLEKTKLDSDARVLKRDVAAALVSLQGRFDFIYMDPPYALGQERQVLSAIREYDLLEEDGRVILEAALERELPFAQEEGFIIQRVKRYKTNQHIFLTLA